MFCFIIIHNSDYVDLLSYLLKQKVIYLLLIDDRNTISALYVIIEKDIFISYLLDHLILIICYFGFNMKLQNLVYCS